MVDFMNKDDGGSAFPNAPLYSLQEEDGIYELLVDEQSSGMTLRDYFAAQAMQAEMSRWKDGHEDGYEGIAELCYCMADAMLKAREA
jgi:hypothetical protein